MLTYKGYVGHVEYDPEARLLFGEVVNTRDTITFKAYRIEDVEKEFQESVDAHLEFCEELGREPSKPYSGNLSLRTTPELHERIIIAATKNKKSANEWMEEVLDAATKI